MAGANPIPDASPLWIEVVTDTYVPDINGVANSLGRLCTGLRELGHRVEIIRSGRAIGPFETSVLSWPLPGYWEIKVGAPWPGELRRRWQRQRPDAVYVAIESPFGFSAATAARKLGIPVIGGFHTNFHEYLSKYGVHRIGSWVWLYQKWFHQRLSRTLVPSPDARDKLAAAGFTSIGVLGRGVDTVLFNPAKRSQDFRHAYGAMGDAPLAVVVGRISIEKNIGLAIRAFEQLKLSCPAMSCVVIGDGPARKKLQKKHPGVHFSGYLTGEDLATAYASADILLFPSETETFGNVVVEGMASGLAVLAYDYAAAGWHGLNGVNLLKVPKGDEAAYLTAAIALLEPDTRHALSAAARQTAEGLGWEEIVSSMAGHFHQVIADQKASAQSDSGA